MAAAITSNMSLALSFSGGISATIVIPTVQNPASPGEHLPTSLVSGANTLTPPAGSTGLVILPPVNSAVTKTLKGVTGDTGVPIAAGLPTFLSLPPAAGALVLTTNGPEIVDIYWI